MRQRLLSPRNDVAFKRIFGTEKNKDILIALLNEALKEKLHKPIVSVKYLNPIQAPILFGYKRSEVDVLCEDEDGCSYIIEMQLTKLKVFEKRSQYYAYQSLISQLKDGEEFGDLKEVLFLAFVDFDLFPKKNSL